MNDEKEHYFIIYMKDKPDKPESYGHYSMEEDYQKTVELMELCGAEVKRVKKDEWMKVKKQIDANDEETWKIKVYGIKRYDGNLKKIRSEHSLKSEDNQQRLLSQ